MTDYDVQDYASPSKIGKSFVMKRRRATGDWTRLGDGFVGSTNEGKRRKQSKPRLITEDQFTPDICVLSSDSSEPSPVKLPVSEPRIVAPRPSSRISDSVRRSRKNRSFPEKSEKKRRRKIYPSSRFQAFENPFDSEANESPTTFDIDFTSPVKVGQTFDVALRNTPSVVYQNDTESRTDRRLSERGENTAQVLRKKTVSHSSRSRILDLTRDGSTSPELTPSHVMEDYISSCQSTLVGDEDDREEEETEGDEVCPIDSLSQSPRSQDRRLLRGSDWLKSADLKTPRKLDEKREEDGSAQKSKKRRFLKDGMAEQLHKLLMRQKSAERFHVHTQDSQKGTSSVRKLVLLISSITFSRALAILHGCVIKTSENGLAERVTIMINKTRVEELKLNRGGTAVILPPWHKLETEDGASVLLCTLPSSVVTVDLLNSQSSQSQEL